MIALEIIDNDKSRSRTILDRHFKSDSIAYALRHRRGRLAISEVATRFRELALAGGIEATLDTERGLVKVSAARDAVHHDAVCEILARAIEHVSEEVR